MNEVKTVDIFSDLTCLSGISTKRAKLFAKLGINNLVDLLFNFPRQYDDWTDLAPLNQKQDGDLVTFRAQITASPRLLGDYRRRRVIVDVSTEENFVVRVTWFNQPWVAQAIKVGDVYYFHGKIKRSGFYFDLVNPYFKKPHLYSEMGMEPIYSLTEGLEQNVVRSAVKQSLKYIDELTDFLPLKLARSLDLISLKQAVEYIHFPQNKKQLQAARRRLAIEELLLIRLGLHHLKQERKHQHQAPIVQTNDTVKLAMSNLREQLPFKLTRSQVEAINDVCGDLRSNVPMNRLLQGDVGAGKTLVAAFAMAYVAYGSGQSIFMAPTSILAEQHYRKLIDFFSSTDIEIALLTSAIKSNKRKKIIDGLRSGEIDILVGTHAVLQEDVILANPVLMITDEQHRFGVNQRAGLQGNSEQQVHRLVMSATPIPRTLGLILYGDLDLTIMSQVPQGRKPITTFVVNSSQLPDVYREFDQELKEGYQAYVICPLIEDSDKIPWQSALNTAEILAERFADYCVAVLHGSMSASEKDDIMQKFLRREIHILVSTTVVEVGVDNPNASLMLINNAECFGLAQLHQLRGRIGRGERESRCFLATDTQEEKSLERLMTISQSTDGFALAEADLALRGPGQFFGVKQHGLPEFKFLSSYRDAELLAQVDKALSYLTEKQQTESLTEHEASDHLDAVSAEDCGQLLQQAMRERYPDFLAKIIL